MDIHYIKKHIVKVLLGKNPKRKILMKGKNTLFLAVRLNNSLRKIQWEKILIKEKGIQRLVTHLKAC